MVEQPRLKRLVLSHLREEFEDGNDRVEIDDLVEYFEIEKTALIGILKELEAESKIEFDTDEGDVWAVGGRFVWQDEEGE